MGCCFNRRLSCSHVYCFIRDDEIESTVEEQVIRELDDWEESVDILLELETMFGGDVFVDEREERDNDIF
jgi:hypothetical protein